MWCVLLLFVLACSGSEGSAPAPLPAPPSEAVEAVEAAPAAEAEAEEPMAEAPAVVSPPVGAAPSSDAAPVKPQAPAPQPAAVAGLSKPPSSLFACETADECVIECDLPGACCGAPCGCKTAVNKAELERIRQLPWAECPARPDCPAMGCMFEEALSATCVKGRCRPGRGM